MDAIMRALKVFSVAILVVSFLGLCSSMVEAQPTGIAPFGTGFSFPVGRVDGGVVSPSGQGVITNYKTPRSSAGDMLSIPIDVHNPGPGTLTNWAGVLAKIHVRDATEVDVTAVKLAPGNVFPIGPPGAPFSMGPLAASPFGPPSMNAQSVPIVFTALNTAWFRSGITLPTSANYPVVDLDLVVKNSDVGGNSDTDITVMFADIVHNPGFSVRVTGTGGGTIIPYGSTTFLWDQSLNVFVQSNIQGQQDMHIQPGQGTPLGGVESMYQFPEPAEPQTGHWIHIEEPILWHVITGQITLPPWTTTTTFFFGGSSLVALPFAATAFIGIEHIPEPTAPLLLAFGVASLVIGFRSRRRRLLE